MKKTLCALCPNVRKDDLALELGINGKCLLKVPVCEEHAIEADETGYDFRSRYMERIIELLYEQGHGNCEGRD